MRIVHFSDLHAGGRITDLRGIFDKRLLGTLNHFCRRRHTHDWARIPRAVALIKQLKPDLVVCTGDLTTLSEPAEFERIQRDLRGLATDRRFELFFVPGNHDCYVPDEPCQRSLREVFATLNRGRWRLEELPVAVEFQHARFVLVNEATPAPLYASYGEIDARTEAWLRANLVAPAPRPTILIGHYPLYDADGYKLSWRRRCKNNGVLQKAFGAGVIRLALCGHIHTPFVRQEANGVMEVCAGSLPHYGLLNVIDFDLVNDRLHQRWVTVDVPEEPGPELAGLSVLARG